MTDEFDKALQNALQTDKKITSFTANNNVYWLKRAEEENRRLSYIFLNTISKITDIPIIQAIPKAEKSKVLALEIERIESFSKHNVKVPQIVAHSQDYIVLTDLGRTMSSLLKDKSLQTIDFKREILQKAIAALLDIHQKKLYLSQAVVRNICINKELEVGFIDFEDDPNQSLLLEQTQARDILLFTTSSARFYISDRDYYKQAIKDLLAQYPDTMVTEISKFASKFNWVRKLPFKDKLGSDYQKMQLAVAALNHIFE
ncbi:MAG: hypothetical protein HWD86_08985 [Kangiellaceae bacterium]|nr:hypothetical protein [Kangiellaceae bacterium]